jgi:S1-C subfamily serine protease
MHIIDQSKNVYGSVSEVTFRDGSILQSKNKFKVQFETNKDAYVYILMHDSLNKVNLLFPDPKTKLDNNVKAITRHTVPKSDRWFRLDDNVGIGNIFVLVSERPLENIKDLLLEMEEVEEPKKRIMGFAKDNNSAFKTVSIRNINDKAFKEITVIKNTEKKVINNEEPGEEHLREMIVRGEKGINNILSGNMILNTVNEGRMQTMLRDMKQNLILEESKGASGITVYRKASPAVVLVVTNEGTGIGSIIDKEGHVLTNWHVVQGHAKVYVLFKPKKDIELKAESAFIASVIKVDQVADLAYLKIENPPENLPILKLGNIDDVEVTQDVHTIGHPGEIWTYTREIINQIKPNYEWAYDNNALHESKVIQTQMPVNTGSSGSPLLNDNAEIIGINSFIRKGDGLNFAVSVDVIREFMERRNSRYDSNPPTTPSLEPVSQKPSYYEYDTTGDGIVDVVEIDSESNEIANMYIVDLNQDGIIDHVKLDQYGNGKIDAVAYDTNKDGKYDTWAYDANEDGYMDRWIER